MLSGSGVAVLIVNWNGGALLERCLDCLAVQTYRPHRIVVVDNGSRDDSLERIARHHPHVHVIPLGANEGFARANNLAVRAIADCEWLALLNPDAFPEPDWLEALVRAAEQHPECASFGSHMRLAEAPSRLDGLGDVYHVSGRAWRDGHRLPEAASASKSPEIFSACAAAALYRRDAFLEVGGFDEAFFCYFEDVDLGFRLRLRGYRSRYVANAVVRHTGSASLGYRSDFALYHGNRNLVWTYVKNMPAPLLALYLPQHLLGNLAAFCTRRIGVIARAKWDALTGLPVAIQQRRAIQATRRISSWTLRKAMAKGILTPYVQQITPRVALEPSAVISHAGARASASPPPES